MSAWIDMDWRHFTYESHEQQKVTKVHNKTQEKRTSLPFSLLFIHSSTPGDKKRLSLPHTSITCSHMFPLTQAATSIPFSLAAFQIKCLCGWVV